VKTIIAGSRDVSKADVQQALEACPWSSSISTVVSGGARGADQAGEQWAQSQNLPVEVFPANWEEYGKSAGPIRNRQMAQAANALLAVWDGRSRGTRNMIEEAKNQGLDVFIYRTDEDHSYSPESLVANLAPIGLDPDAVLKVDTFPFSQEKLDELRATHRGGRFARRSGDNILLVPLGPARPCLSDKPETIRVGDHLRLLCALVREHLIQIFSGVGRGEILDYRPVKLVSSRPEDDLVAQVLQSGVPPGLSQRVGYHFDARYSKSGGNEPTVLLSIDVVSHVQIDEPCSTLLRAGVKLEGRYVRIVTPSTDPRLRPKAPTVGKVSAVLANGTLRLDDHRDGHETVEAEAAFLEPRVENLQACLEAIYPRKHRRIGEQLRQQAGLVKQGPSRLGRIRRLLQFLQGQSWHIAPGLEVRLGDLLEGKDDNFLTCRRLRRPDLLFHPSRSSHRSISNYEGLDRFGPYDAESFEKKSLRIAVICQEQLMGSTQPFMEAFFDGIRGKVYGKGFIRRFNLSPPYVEPFAARSASPDAYADACRAVLDAGADSGKPWDMVFIQTEERFKRRQAQANPYLIAKSILLSERIPTQAFTKEVTEKKGYWLSLVLNNMSLQVYAKLGGIPWSLPIGDSPTNELVIGMRSYEAIESRFGGRSRYMGMTTVFTGEGQYLVEGRTRVVSFKDYTDALLTSTKAAIKQAESILNAVHRHQRWQPDAPLRLVFHVQKRLKYTEIDAVRQLVKDRPTATFAFLELSEEHPYSLLDLSEPGIQLKRGGVKGKMAPPVGLLATLDDHEALLALRGANKVKRSTDGLPRPLKLRLHPHSTLTDLGHLAEQVFAFSQHSWRSFDPIPVPITLSYSGRIAKMLTMMREVDEWDESRAIGMLSRQRWFL